MELAKDIATNLGVFTEEEITVCELIGLFHEIGSFDKNPEFHIINDNNEDYTTWGCGRGNNSDIYGLFPILEETKKTGGNATIKVVD